MQVFYSRSGIKMVISWVFPKIFPNGNAIIQPQSPEDEPRFLRIGKPFAGSGSELYKFDVGVKSNEKFFTCVFTVRNRRIRLISLVDSGALRGLRISTVYNLIFVASQICINLILVSSSARRSREKESEIYIERFRDEEKK